MADVTPLPTLSQIRNWDTELLSQAADDWDAEAAHWESTYEQNYRRLAEADWKGQGREAALERAGLDLVKVRGPAWQLREAVTAARYGFDQQNGAKSRRWMPSPTPTKPGSRRTKTSRSPIPKPAAAPHNGPRGRPRPKP